MTTFVWQCLAVGEALAVLALVAVVAALRQKLEWTRQAAEAWRRCVGDAVTGDAQTQRVSDALLEVWRRLRDGHEWRDGAHQIVTFAQEAGLLTPTQAELWTARFEHCPGHDDEGGRDWCAYGCKVRTPPAGDGES